MDLGNIISKEETSVEKLSGKKIAVDAYNAIYQFLSIIRQKDGMLLTDSKGRVTSHLSGLFYRNARLLSAGVKPVYVFDGPPPLLKRGTIQERSQVKQNAEKKWAEARERGDMEQARMYAQATSKLTPEMVAESIQLLELMGIPVVRAPSEGEAQAAFMSRRATVWASASQDYDALLFGSPFLVRNLNLTGKRKLPKRNVFVDVAPELVDLGANLSSLGISQEKLIWIGLLCGTDFNDGVRGIGPKKALKLVKECPSLADVCSRTGLVEADVRPIMDFFLNPPVFEVEVSFKDPDVGQLLKFLCDEHSFSMERVEGTAKSLLSFFKEKKSQTSLGDWA